MTEYTSPVPMPALDATPAEIYRGIYGMPMFVTLPTADLPGSEEFWCRGLGFENLFTIPGRLVHLRRWAFQDVLLVSGEAGGAPAGSVSFACVLSQLDEVAARCEEIRPGCTSGPVDQPWNTRDLTVVTPERARVVLTAALPMDPDGARAESLRELGFDIPRSGT
ncbi:VOC family protein [Amycolatopsis acidicola]|uniref:VOC family protein n=1 Tax=Amycolatopsis acidicola TaxID=2596893 RepID=A0A5N0UMN8_9PSEU|nr:VOC family protein [Amycolatopsis acidicola]KAA9151198.1 VOC family protein [Amycolatopsis acidicola]